MINKDSVVERYGFDCYLCGTPIDMSASRAVGDEDWYFGLHIDHVIPKKLGGTDDIENLRPVHGVCNLKKSEAPLIEHLKKYYPERLAKEILAESAKESLPPRPPQKVGYIRTNSVHLSSSTQTESLEGAGVERIFSDVYYGSNHDFPGLDSLLNEVRDGDTVVVESLDRFATSLKKLFDTLKILTRKNVNVELIKEGVNTSDPEGKVYIKAIVSLVDFTTNAMSERTKTGLSSARARGRNGGRPSKLTEEQQDRIVELYKAKKLTVREIAEMFDISSPTVYRTLENRAPENK